MRGATDCAKRLKPLFHSLRAKLGKPGHPPLGDPITQLILGVLSRDTPESKAQEGLERMRSMVVDYNELRVIPPIELAQTLGDFPDARLKCEDVSRALNAIFAIEHGTTLDRLADQPRREVCDYLDRVDGLEPYTRARIRLLGLRQHAIPLDEAMWALARRDQIVDPRCGLEEAQGFLERHISEEDALEFFTLLRRHAWSEFGPAVKRREVERILSVPPDRTSRNMLQAVTASLAGEPEEFAGEPDADWEGEPPAEALETEEGEPAEPVSAAKPKPRPAKAERKLQEKKTTASAAKSRKGGKAPRAASRRSKGGSAGRGARTAGDARKSGRKGLSRATG